MGWSILPNAHAFIKPLVLSKWLFFISLAKSMISSKKAMARYYKSVLSSSKWRLSTNHEQIQALIWWLSHKKCLWPYRLIFLLSSWNIYWRPIFAARFTLMGKSASWRSKYADGYWENATHVNDELCYTGIGREMICRCHWSYNLGICFVMTSVIQWRDTRW